MGGNITIDEDLYVYDHPYRLDIIRKDHHLKAASPISRRVQFKYRTNTRMQRRVGW
jgi:hypothetical protein